jgi:MoaF N-terminal domain
MTAASQAQEVRGKTMQWTWTEGPTKGTTHEHVFHDDGTVEWHAVGGEQQKGAAKAGGKAAKKEKPEYAAMKAADGVVAVSYLSPESGYTLTVVLNFNDHKMVGIASGAKDWHPVKGTFKVVN